MTDINVLQRTQRIIVNMASSSVSVINAGPQGPAGPEGNNHVYQQPTPPLTPEPDDLWVDTNDMSVYVYYYDGASYQWVMVASISDSVLATEAIAIAEDAEDAVLAETAARIAADALKVNKSGDTVTGNMIMTSAFPRFYFQHTTGNSSGLGFRRADGTLAYQVVGTDNGDLTFMRYDAAGVYVANVLTVKGNGEVHVPTPTHTASATRKDWVEAADALKANLSGAAFTGAISSTGTVTGTRINTTHTSPMIMMDETDQAADARKWRFFSSGGIFSLIAISDNEAVSQIAAFAVNRATGGVALNGSGVTSVSVPAATAANHAAQVTAYDATTGRLAIGGHEIGDTGWRNVESLLINGWTGNVWICRTGDVVAMRTLPLNGSAQTLSRFMNAISGFAMAGGVGHVALGQGVAAGVAHIEVSGGWQIGSTSDSIYSHHTWVTTDAWPTTLPGVAV